MITMRVLRPGLLALGAACAAVAAFALTAGDSHAQSSDEAVISVVQPAQTAVQKGDAIAIDINIENAKNTGSVGFDLLFNADILRAADPEKGEGDFADKGDFLGSTGRDVVCTPASDAGVVRMRCVTLRPSPAGPDGAGRLATIHLVATGSGTTELRVDNLQVVTVSEGATTQAVRGQNASIKVQGGGGFNWLLWAPIIAIGAIVVAGGVGFGAMRMRAGGGSPAPASGT